MEYIIGKTRIYNHIKNKKKIKFELTEPDYLAHVSTGAYLTPTLNLLYLLYPKEPMLRGSQASQKRPEHTLMGPIHHGSLPPI